MLTDKHLKSVTYHTDAFAGTQRIYQLPNGWGLSCIDSPVAHSYPFAWEIAVLRNEKLDYSTELTSDVEVFSTDEEAQAFIDRAFTLLEKLP